MMTPTTAIPTMLRATQPYLDVGPREADLALLVRLRSVSVGQGIALLLDAARPDELLDPATVGADVPWAYMLRGYKDQPDAGWEIVQAWKRRPLQLVFDPEDTGIAAEIDPTHASSCA